MFVAGTESKLNLVGTFAQMQTFAFDFSSKFFRCFFLVLGVIACTLKANVKKLTFRNKTQDFRPNVYKGSLENSSPIKHFGDELCNSGKTYRIAVTVVLSLGRSVNDRSLVDFGLINIDT